MTWRQLSVAVEEAQAEPLSEAFLRLGALSVGFEDAGDQPLFEPKPGETPLWRKTRVVALFEERADVDKVRKVLGPRFGGSGWACTDLEDQVWERAWLEHFRPMRFGRRLWVVPSGFDPPEPDAVNVWLDPGLAFGTGTHPTTALCLEWLEGQDLAGRTLIDYGCGSGILAIAALKLGAVSTYGVDIDPQALTATLDNARKNRVGSRLQPVYPQDLPDLRADVVVANILAGPLAELSGELTRHLQPGGKLALSGILETQMESVLRAYQSHIEFALPVVQDDWVLLTGSGRLC